MFEKTLVWAPVTLALILLAGAFIGSGAAHSAPLGPLAFAPQHTMMGDGQFCTKQNAARQAALNVLDGMPVKEAFDAANPRKKRRVCEHVDFSAAGVEVLGSVVKGGRQINIVRMLVIEIRPHGRGKVSIAVTDEDPFLYSIAEPDS